MGGSKASLESDKSFQIKKTLTNGDCLFSAVFRALRDKNLLDKFNDCYNFGNEEKKFIRNFRKYLSNNIKFLESYESLFANIIEQLKNDSDYKKTFKTIIKDIGDVRDVLKYYMKNNLFKIKNLKNFLNDIKKQILIEGKYTGQIETEIVGDMLIDCDIHRVLSRDKASLIKFIKINKMDNNAIYLLLRNEHWEYI